MKVRNILTGIVLVLGIAFIPFSETNANSEGPECGPERHVVKGRVDSIPIYDNNENQIGWEYVIVCDVPSSLDIYCCIPIALE